MKTTNELREKITRQIETEISMAANAIGYLNRKDQFPVIIVRDLLDDIDSLEHQLRELTAFRDADNVALKKALGRLKWAEEKLKQAKGFVWTCKCNWDVQEKNEWLSDLEAGPKAKGNVNE